MSCPRLRWMLCCLLLSLGSLTAQSLDTDLVDFNTRRQQQQRTALLILGGWAVGNIASGAYFSTQTTGDTRYFHRMNAYWNTINLGIAAFALYTLRGTDPAAADLYSSIDAHYQFQKILLLNAGLDVGYVLGGVYLLERSKNTTNKPERMRGYGRAVMVQGGFLLAFDLINYFVQVGNNARIAPLLSSVRVTGEGIGLQLTF